MKLSVIIPVFNESQTISELIEKVLDVPLEKEVIAVDDASTDNSFKQMKIFEGENFKLLQHAENKGKGAAIKTALEHVKGDLVIIQDGDLETNPHDYVHLIQPILQGKTSVVYGSRNLKPSEGKRYFLYDWGGRLISAWANFLYNQNITDEAACYKVFKTDVIKSIRLEHDRFEFCPEVTAKVSKMGIKIVELPMHYYPRNFAEGKKMKWTDGVRAFWILLKYRFTS